MNYILFAVPVFLLLIGVEFAFLRGTGRGHFYRFADSLANLGTGMIQQVSGIFFKVVTFGLYAAVHPHVPTPLGLHLAPLIRHLGANMSKNEPKN